VVLIKQIIVDVAAARSLQKLRDTRFAANLLDRISISGAENERERSRPGRLLRGYHRNTY